MPQFISKTSNFLIPIIGWSMYLTGHVPLKRMDRRSQMARAWRRFPGPPPSPRIASGF